MGSCKLATDRACTRHLQASSPPPMKSRTLGVEGCPITIVDARRCATGRPALELTGNNPPRLRSPCLVCLPTLPWIVPEIPLGNAFEVLFFFFVRPASSTHGCYCPRPGPDRLPERSPAGSQDLPALRGESRRSDAAMGIDIDVHHGERGPLQVYGLLRLAHRMRLVSAFGPRTCRKLFHRCSLKRSS